MSSLLPSGLETWKDANFNLTNLMHNMFPLERVIEIELFDTNGTKFAYLNPGLGATVNVTDVHRQMPYFWKRLTVTADGSLILNRLQMRDNRLEIRAIAHLTSLKRKMNPKRAGRSSMESISAKTIRFLVNDGKSSQGNFHLSVYPLTPSVRYIVRQTRLSIFLFKGKLATELKLFKFVCYLSLLLMFNLI